MSKIGVKPISFDDTCQITIADKVIEIKGKHGTMSLQLPIGIVLKKDDKNLIVSRTSETRQSKALHGTTRSLIANAIAGINTFWEKKLEIIGTGFKVKMDGENLTFDLGYSHPVVFKKVDGITFAIEGNSKVKVMGIDRQLVGQVASKIKAIKKPDPYKGKGIRYDGEKIKLKPGKKAKTAGPAK